MKIFGRHIRFPGGSRDGSGAVRAGAPRSQSRYLRDTKSGVMASRGTSLVPSREEVRRVWTRSAALAMDLIHNSGMLKGAADQVIADTVGVGLTLTPTPDMTGLGYSDSETAEWSRLVARRWQAYSRNPRECDMRGRLSLAQQVDVSLRWYMAFGEVTGVYDYFTDAERQRYNIETGTKLCLVPPTRLVQDTNRAENIFQGVRTDQKGRAIGYRFSVQDGLSVEKRDTPASDDDGRAQVLHVFDPNCATEMRGISPIAPAFRKHLQSEMLDDTTLQMAILQTIFAVSLTSESPSQDAFEALSALESENGGGGGIADEFMGLIGSQLQRASESRIAVGPEAQVNHLAPGEKLTFESPGVPGQDFLPFSASLKREMARAIGISYGGFTLDHTAATYASTNMENASLWPVVMRRRERIAAPVCQSSYALWLDEEIGEGRIPFKGGYAAFRARRAAVSMAEWQGPPKPSADDYKASRASSTRLENSTSSVAIESGALGIDSDALFDQQRKEHERYIAAGMRSPYSPKSTVTPSATEVIEERDMIDA